MIPINLETMRSYCASDEDDMYTVKYSIMYTDINKIKMDVRIREKKDIRNPKIGKSYDKRWKSRLNFDLQKGIFYNGSKTINGSYITDFTGSNQLIKQNIKGTFPIIRIMGTDNMYNEYYFINGYWHEYGEKNYLLKNYTR